MAKASEIVENGQPGSSTTVLRAISVLEALATAPESGMGVTELSRTVGANRSTIYRILGALMPLGYVREGATAGTFRLGFRVVELGESILEQLDIRKIAGPYLRQLCTETQQTCHLSILEGTEMVYVDKVEPDEQSIRLVTVPGRRGALHCTAMGKAYLAALGPDKWTALVDQLTLTPRTDTTITDRAALEAELALTAERGWSTDLGENVSWVSCAGAAILGRDGEPVAAISTSGPGAEIPAGQIEDLLGPAVRKVAEQISAGLGHASVQPSQPA